MKKTFLLIIFIVIVFSLYKVAACSDDQRIMKLSAGTNAHGEIWSGTFYPVDICYDGIFGSPYAGTEAEPHACTGINKVIGLSADTNAHAEIPGIEGYTTNVCYGDLSCMSRTGTDCASDEKLVVSLSSETNAHLANDSSYPTKICCKSKSVVITPIPSGRCPADLISYWRFNENSGTNANDVADQNLGTVNGATWTKGKLNSALNFDGVDDYVNISHNENLNLKGNFTIEAWINMTGYDNVNKAPQKIIGKLGEGEPAEKVDDYSFYICGDPWGVGYTRVYPQEGDIRRRCTQRLRFQSENNWTAQGNSNITLNEWHHVTITYTKEKNNFTIYLDGKPDGSYIDPNFNPTYDQLPLRISSTQDSYPFNGTIDNVAIWSKALSAEEIKDNYNDGYGKDYCAQSLFQEERLDFFSWFNFIFALIIIVIFYCIKVFKSRFPLNKKW